ncbi:ABC transporter ATP-binding protein [Actinoplanes utahensis]|uniref:ABC transporter ATP-binding protein n=1 Tax=Actinoplanes utahensis TaxID=1869 RepID=UPI000A007A23|nr:ABC transporter ATP-binding protein [Actinoplanes utahensis]GIF30431.1 macrolide ABC transporter ATP-binding protein [Actinoplanes utahensis]
MIRITDARKAFPVAGGGELVAVAGVGAEIERGTSVALTGPSGSGKSTLLHLIGAIERLDAGSIVVGGREIGGLSGKELAAYRRTVGFVFQRFHLLPALTALDNVIAPVLPFRTAFDKRQRALELLDLVGLKDRAGALPSQLSGGQQQRVAIARALVNDPPLLLADEPTGNLDSRTGESIVDLLLSLRDDRGATVVVATHDPGLAERCDGSLRLRDGVLV